MRNFDNFRIFAIITKFESNFRARASGALQKAEAFKEFKNIPELINWASDSTDSSSARYNMGSFFCRNACASSLTEIQQLNGMLHTTMISGFIIRIPKNKEMMESLNFIKSIDLIIDYAVMNDSYIDVYCSGGNSIGLIVGLLRDFTNLTKENVLEKVKIYPEFSLFLEVKMGTENIKQYLELHMEVLNFLSKTNRNGESIHNSWREFVGEMQTKNLKSYFLYLKKLNTTSSLDITYKKRVIRDLDSHILFVDKVLDAPTGY